jgi:signal transduction histidine kinase
MADTDRLRRAVINVYENACHALAQASEAGGKRTCRITVETRVRRNRYEIIVSDSGDGIPQETLPKIFEPLFSTKNFGVGLGLPTVKQIMEQHSGGVEAGNGRRQGARFVLWLPLVPEMQEIEG